MTIAFEPEFATLTAAALPISRKLGPIRCLCQSRFAWLLYAAPFDCNDSFDEVALARGVRCKKDERV